MALNHSEQKRVTCGNIVGFLYTNRMFCPGIHQNCIWVHEQGFMTPKAFTIMGEKAKLKDWKSAIRVEGVTIRRLMDSGQLDFADHTNHCSGRCAARKDKDETNCVNGIKMELTNTLGLDQFDKDNDLSPPTLTPLPASQVFRAYDSSSVLPSEITTVKNQNKQLMPVIIRKNPTPPPSLGATLGRIPTQESVNVRQSTQNVFPGISNSTDVLIGDNHNDAARGDAEFESSLLNGCGDEVSEEQMELYMKESTGTEAENTIDEQEAVMFWTGITEMGIVNEFFKEVHTALNCMKAQFIRKGVTSMDAKKMSTIVSQLGLMSRLEVKLSSHKTTIEKDADELGKQMEELKKKLIETEQRQRQLKRKSDCFEHLIEIGTFKIKKEIKKETLQDETVIKQEVDDNFQEHDPVKFANVEEEFKDSDISM